VHFYVNKFKLTQLNEQSLSDSVSTLKDAYFKRKKLSDEDISYAVHDIALYEIPQNLSNTEFDTYLENAFFLHPFIEAFTKEIDRNIDGLFFGRVKIWFQDNTTTVPIPRRWELTTNTQILYRWITELSNGKYVVDVPYRRSERIMRIK